MTSAFTLVELLIVITIIVVLLALLAPALDKAINAAEIVRCAAQHHAMGALFADYAVTHNRKYPSGKRNTSGPGSPPDQTMEHAIWISFELERLIESYAGNNRTVRPSGWGGVPAILTDPSFENFGYQSAGNGVSIPNPTNIPGLQGGGYVIGYHYLGGHPYLSLANQDGKVNPSTGRPLSNWKSPLGLVQKGSGELTACHNTWAPDQGGNSFVVVPHTKAGGPFGAAADVGGYFNIGNTSRPDDPSVDSAGANIGFTDSSVAWRQIEDMHERTSAATAQGDPAGWPALW